MTNRRCGAVLLTAAVTAVATAVVAVPAAADPAGRAGRPIPVQHQLDLLVTDGVPGALAHTSRGETFTAGTAEIGSG